MKRLMCSFLLLLIFTCGWAQVRTLEDYLSLGVTNSPLLKDLNNQMAGARLDSMRILAGMKPQLTASSAGLYAPTRRGYGYSPSITNGQSLNGLITLNKPLVSRNYLKAQLTGVVLQRDSLNNAVKLSEQDLRRALTDQYILTYGSLQQQKFNQEVVSLLSREEDLLKRLTRSNVYRQSDYLTFLVTLKQAQLQLSQSQLQYKTDFGTLNYLAGISDTTVMEVTRPELQPSITTTRNSSVFFKQFQLDSLRILNNRKLIDYSYRPRLGLFADAGYNSDLTGQYYKNFGSSVGFSVSVPIYDGHQRQLLYKKLSLEQETRRGYIAMYNSQHNQQVGQLNQQIAGYDKLIASVYEQIKYSENLIRVDTKLLQTGDLKIADLILAINNYLSIKNLLTQNIVSRMQLVNQLNYWSK
jgi:outer membrane protein TolC